MPNSDLPMPTNLFSPLAELHDSEVSETLVETRSLKLERIVSTGQATPPGEWYDQNRDEWVTLLCGSATLQFEEPAQTISLVPGDWLLIPAHRRHRVEQTAKDSASIWIALHFER
jgi:cupin 2 domain-containing protein